MFEHTPYTTTALSIADRKNDFARRSHQLATLGILLPHLKRAIDLQGIVSRQRAAAVATQTLFDRWAHAAFVLDVAGRMVGMNAAASRLLEGESIISLDRTGRLRLSNPGENSALDIAVRRHARLGDGLDLSAADGVQDGLILARAAPKPPLHVMVWPLPAVDSVSQLGGERGRVLLMVLDPLQVQRTPVAWLSRRYGFTHGETRLAEAIVNGVPLAEAAEQLGIQLSTARSRLKIILGKSGCNRQVDLVRLALSVPPVSQS